MFLLKDELKNVFTKVSHRNKTELRYCENVWKFLWLDASSKKKWSRHLIIHSTKYALKNIEHVQNFVDRIALRIVNDTSGAFPVIYKEQKKRNEKKKRVISSKTYFIDSGIYTKYRNFRLFGSSKFKSRGNRPLKLYNYSSKKFSNFNNVERKVFLQTFVSYSNKEMENLTVISVKAPLVFARHSSKRALKKKSIGRTSKKSGCKKVKLNDNTNLLTTQLSQKLRYYFEVNVLPKWPKIRKNSKITAIKEFGSFHKTIIIGLSAVKFCKNVKREHKNNNIYFCVSVNNASYYQKCHSQECKGYRSEKIPLVLK